MNDPSPSQTSKVIIVGAGAAGLATAIFTARRLPHASVIVLDGAKKIGAKILVSGGGRCNVTNVTVKNSDYWGGNSGIIKQVLSSLPVSKTIAFFKEIGVALHEEEYGKLFPDSNKAQTILSALVGESERLGVQILPEHRVLTIRHDGNRFLVETQSAGMQEATCLVLATGGQSLPKTGSDGGGYLLAQALGHTIMPTTPALAPLLLEGDFHVPLSGISQEVQLTITPGTGPIVRLSGPMLWTHFGVSGPVAMNASRHWHHARLSGDNPIVTVNFVPGQDFASVQDRFVEMSVSQPRSSIRAILSRWMPGRVAEVLLRKLGIDTEVSLAHLSREVRKKIIHALLAWPLPVRDSRGYAYAEATAGGVSLDEIEPVGMESVRCPGLFLVGEVLDVDGRIGGFNFQWAWSSGFAAARGIERYLSHLAT